MTTGFSNETRLFFLKGDLFRSGVAADFPDNELDLRLGIERRRCLVNRIIDSQKSAEAGQAGFVHQPARNLMRLCQKS
jgi:hypothetical protein